MKKLTQEEFITKCEKTHGGKYDYSLVNYINYDTKVKIICSIHGEFEQKPDNHINGNGCPKCGGTEKYTKFQFIEKVQKIHGKKYDYTLVNYINNNTKIKIICSIHGEFLQTPSNHLKKRGCPKCFSKFTKTNNQFILESKKIHTNIKFDYSLIKYINDSTKVKIICPTHGIFEQIPNAHLRGQGCPKCRGLNKTNQELINEFKKIHGNKYDYSLVNYLNAITKIKIICKKHGIFEQSPNSHLSGSGCIKCKESKGEKTIREILIKNNIKFESQKRFSNCKNKKTLPFDFYLPEINLCIEYNGQQHYEIGHFCDEKSLNYIQQNDKIKKIFCQNNNINFLIIKFNESIITKLKQYINIKQSNKNGINTNKKIN